MITAQQNNSDNLITLKQASERLNVSIETLLSWNEHNILKSTITKNGEIGYTQNQLDKFVTIRKVVEEVGINSKNTEFIPQIHHPKPAEIFMHESPIAKPFASPVVLSFATILVVLISAALTPQQGLNFLLGDNEKSYLKFAEKVLGVQTSKLELPGQALTSLPIQLKDNVSADKNLRDESESVFKEKITAPAIFASNINLNTSISSKQNQMTTSASQGGQAGKLTYKSDKESVLNEIDDTDTYASAVSFEEVCPTCNTNDTDAIDDSGNIKGEAKTDNLASVVGGIEDMMGGNSGKKVNTDAANQIIFLFIGALTVIFIFQRQFAYAPAKRPQLTLTQSHASHNEAIQKTLEIGQKTDGTVVLYFQGNEYKISKPELSSESDQFIERLMSLTQPGIKEIEYDTLKHGETRLTTPLSRLVTRLGFVGLKRDLFFPRTSKNEVLFRKYLTEADLSGMNLTTEQILDDLKETS